MMKKYRAFISYSHADIKFARWLQKKIENYKIPKRLREKYPHLPRDLKRSIFRDEEELPTSSALPDNLTNALEGSEFLIVIASPYSVNSKWVNKEIQHFNAHHNNGKILAIIKAGEPYAKEGQLEAFPHALTENGEEPIAGDARHFRGRKRAVMKLIAGLLQVDFADLWEREVKESQKRKLWLGGALGLFAVIAIYSSFQFQGNLVNDELQQIEKRIATIEYTLHHGVSREEDAITLNIELEKLEEEKLNKEASLEALGRLESSMGKKAKRVYQEKGAKEAIKILTSKERIAQREREKQELSKESLTLAKLYIETHEYAKANETFQEAISLFYSFKNVHEYGRFLRDQREPQKAIEYYEALSNTPLQRKEKIKLLSSLALVYDENNQLKESEKSYKKALKLYREKPNTMREDFSRTLDNMGNLYRMTNRIEDAISSHQEALTLERALEKREPKKYRFNLFGTLNNLGNAYKDIKEFQQSEEYYSEALVIIRTLVKEEPNKYSGSLALLLGNMASIFDINRKFSQSNTSFEEALTLVEQLAKENPALYNEILAERLYVASIRYLTANQPEASEASLERSVKLSRRLFKKNPNLYSELLSQVLYLRGVKKMISKEPNEALLSLEEALDVVEVLKERNPDYYQDRAGGIYMKLSTLYLFNQQKPKKAEESILEALRLYRSLAKKHPRKFNDSVADSLDTLADLYTVQKQTTKAEEAHIESVTFYQALAEKNPDYYNHYLATKLESLALFYGGLGEVKKAEDIYKKVLKIQRDLVKSYPQLYRKDLATTLWKFSFLYLEKLRNFPKGEILIEEAIAIQEQLVQENPKAYIERLSSFLEYMGTYYSLAKKFNKAEATLLKGLKLNKQLIKIDGKKHKIVLAKNFYTLASLYNKTQRYKEAKVYYSKALTLYQEKRELNTFEKEAMAGLLEELAQLKESEKNEKNFEEIEKLYLEALSLRELFVKKGRYLSKLNLATQLGRVVDFYHHHNRSKAKAFFTKELEAKRVAYQESKNKLNSWALGLTIIKGVEDYAQPLSLLDEAKNAIEPFRGDNNIDILFKSIEKIKEP